jgi:hypothetical protein
MKSPDHHPPPLAALRRVGDDARWLHWRALCAWTFRLWGVIMASAMLTLHWLSEDLVRLIVDGTVTAVSTLLYREIVLFHWARQLRILPLIQAMLRNQSAEDDAAAASQDDPP